jgi:hypothetical protein
MAPRLPRQARGVSVSRTNSVISRASLLSGIDNLSNVNEIIFSFPNLLSDMATIQTIKVDVD